MEKYSPDEEDFPGRLLHQAALWDNAELIEDLLKGDHIQYINSQDSWGRTALHAAAITESSRCLGVLLSAGANPNVVCGPRGHHCTPLHTCAEHGHDDNIKKLLQYNVDLSLLDGNGSSALEIAHKLNNSSSVELLKLAEEKNEADQLEIHSILRNACLQVKFLKTTLLNKYLKFVVCCN